VWGLCKFNDMGGGGDGCLKAPKCLEPTGMCITSDHRVGVKERPECKDYPEFFCGKAVYTLPSTQLKITLPVMALNQLSELYAKHFTGQRRIISPKDKRPSEQAETILGAHKKSGMKDSGLTVVEMGCAAGWVLYNLKQVAGNGGRLVCFEANPHHIPLVKETFQMARTEVNGLSTELIGKLFTPGVLNESSVDIFTSSHTLEHLADPCPWLAEIYRVLTPGGLVFTEVPDQDNDPAQGLVRGQFHLLYFKESTFKEMMSNAGFEHVSSVTTTQNAVRAIFRKPH